MFKLTEGSKGRTEWKGEKEWGWGEWDQPKFESWVNLQRDPENDRRSLLPQSMNILSYYRVCAHFLSQQHLILQNSPPSLPQATGWTLWLLDLLTHQVPGHLRQALSSQSLSSAAGHSQDCPHPCHALESSWSGPAPVSATRQGPPTEGPRPPCPELSTLCLVGMSTSLWLQALVGCWYSP